MTKYDKEEERNMQLLTMEKLNLIYNVTASGTNIVLSNSNTNRSSLNFNHQYASIFIDKIVGYQDLELCKWQWRAWWGECSYIAT